MYSKKELVIRYILICTLGVLLHFTYDWSGSNFLIGLFSAVNESTFQHLKLIFFPMLFLTIWDIFKKNPKQKDFLVRRTVGVLYGMATIVFLFYTIWGVLGTRYDWINIAIYFIGVFIAFYMENSKKYNYSINNFTCIIILAYFTIAFFMFTYNSSNIGIFFDFDGVGPKDYFR